MTKEVERLAMASGGLIAPGRWVSFDCPFCGDRRKRGGILLTESGGFRYKCFNAGCEYTVPAGWEPGSPFSRRVRDIFRHYGVGLPRIKNPAQRASQSLSVPFPKLRFDPVSVPKYRSVFDDTEYARDALSYLRSRSPMLPYMAEWVVMEKFPGVAFCLFRNGGKVIGWFGRRFEGAGRRFSVHLSSGFVPFQERFMVSSDQPLFIVESPIDAVLIGGVASMSSTPAKNLKSLIHHGKRKRIIVIPDNDVSDSMIHKGYHPERPEILRVPDCYKDIGDMVSDRGLVKTAMWLYENTKNH